MQHYIINWFRVFKHSAAHSTPQSWHSVGAQAGVGAVPKRKDQNSAEPHLGEYKTGNVSCQTDHGADEDQLASKAIYPDEIEATKGLTFSDWEAMHVPPLIREHFSERIIRGRDAQRKSRDLLRGHHLSEEQIFTTELGNASEAGIAQLHPSTTMATTFHHRGSLQNEMPQLSEIPPIKAGDEKEQEEVEPAVAFPEHQRNEFVAPEDSSKVPVESNEKLMHQEEAVEVLSDTLSVATSKQQAPGVHRMNESCAPEVRTPTVRDAGKKHRGHFRGPLHKMAKEMRKMVP